VKSGRVLFNPFIVLSDVTISMIVVMASLLMLFSACITTAAQIERRREQQARKIQQAQQQIYKEYRSDLRSGDWDHHVALFPARGLQSYQFQFPIDMFDEPRRVDRLSAHGRRKIRRWARLWGPRLASLQGDGARADEQEPAGSQRKKMGSLIEIQVRGHCRRSVPGNPWSVSLRRDRDVADLLWTEPSFPRHLISICGYAWHRRAYEPTEEVHRKWREGWKEWRGKTGKTALEDRIDIVLLFAGDQYDNNFVCAWDGERLYGPLNDPSVPWLWSEGPGR
jgi:hypothetical protein